MASAAFRICALAASVVIALASLSVAGQSKRRGGRSAGKGAGKIAKPASPWPSFEARRGEWVRRKEAAADAGVNGPDPLTQYLVAEVIVTGVFDTDTGMGVFLLATPTGNTFFASTGATLYNGSIVDIVSGSSGFVEDTEIVFVERTGKTGGERRIVKRVEEAPDPSAPEAP